MVVVLGLENRWLAVVPGTGCGRDCNLAACCRRENSYLVVAADSLLPAVVASALGNSLGWAGLDTLSCLCCRKIDGLTSF